MPTHDSALIVTFGLLFYFTSLVVSTTRKVQYDGAIILINLIFGWTVLGWIAALIWAVVDQPAYQPSAPEQPEQVTVTSRRAA